MIACYCRVSTEDQNLDRQLTGTTDYAQQKLDSDLADVETYRDKSTGTNTDRSGYKNMMTAVESGEVEHVVAYELSRLSRSLRDLDRTVERIVEQHSVTLHFVSESLVFKADTTDPFQRLQLQLLGAFAEFEASIRQQNTKEGLAARLQNDDYHHGPAPLGFEKDGGRLIEAANYDRVVGVLDMVQKGDLSKRKAAQELDTSRPTINRALDRVELYGL